jgi:HD superfamily phosphodiesterase
MKVVHNRIWRLALPYLREGKKKNFVLHTKMVIKGIELLLKKENGNEDILIPAAILHDVGWSRVPIYLQKAKGGLRAKKAQELHLKYSVPIIKKILRIVDFENNTIRKVTETVLSHKFRNPRILDKKLLIDADTLADVFREQFYTDAKIYNIFPQEFYHIRKNNKFYTNTAQQIFQKELKKREQELGLTPLSPS